MIVLTTLLAAAAAGSTPADTTVAAAADRGLPAIVDSTEADSTTAALVDSLRAIALEIERLDELIESLTERASARVPRHLIAPPDNMPVVVPDDSSPMPIVIPRSPPYMPTLTPRGWVRPPVTTGGEGAEEADGGDD